MIHEEDRVVARIQDWRPRRPSTPPLVFDIPRASRPRARSRQLRRREASAWAVLVTCAAVLGALLAAHGFWWW